MSYQAYLDALESTTGRTPQQLLDEAAELGYGPTTKASVVLDWLAGEYGIGRGHAMALYGVLKNGPGVPEKHVGSSGSHRDDAPTLRLDGIAARCPGPVRAPTRLYSVRSAPDTKNADLLDPCE